MGRRLLVMSVGSLARLNVIVRWLFMIAPANKHPLEMVGQLPVAYSNKLGMLSLSRSAKLKLDVPISSEAFKDIFAAGE